MFDTLQLSRTFLFFHPVHDLGSISEYFGFSSAGSHRAEKDTENCGVIFQRLIEEAASYPLKTITKLLDIIRSCNAPNLQLYINLADELKQSGNLRSGLLESTIEKPIFDNVYEHEGENNISTYNTNNVFSPQGAVAEILENYEERPSQIDYCAEILKIISFPKGIGVLEAGTGLGKSLAYLFPAIKHSMESKSNNSVIISCYTKNLQDQLFHKDLPIISRALEVPIKATLLKGRTNYICKTRLNWLIDEKKKILSSKHKESLLPVIIWMQYTKTGDLSKYKMPKGLEIIKGIGDDAAYWKSGDFGYCITSDTLVENVHFKLMYFSADKLGEKAVAVNLSDIAAMGANPMGMLINLGVTNNLSLIHISEPTRPY